MKKVFIVICLGLVIIFSLVGCNAQSIKFSSVFCPIEEGNNINLGIEFGSLFHTRETLGEFYDKEIFENVDKDNELKKYDDTFFENNSLLIVIFWGDKNCNKDIKSISRRNHDLWITVETESMKEYNEISRFLIEVSKEDVLDIKEINYKIINII